jgi:heme/copper-type cytochrome/quinol oxidase subunit 2
MQWAGHVVLQSENPSNSAQAVNFDFCFFIIIIIIIWFVRPLLAYCASLGL